MISVYTNIDTKHALKVLGKFPEELEEEGKLPPDFDIDTIVQAATLTMHWNLFEYGDSFSSNSLAFTDTRSANLFRAMEKKISFMIRFVDDIFGVALVGGEDDFSRNEWRQFEVDTDVYGIPDGMLMNHRQVLIF